MCYSIVYHYNGAQRYGHFLQVGRLDGALILLGLALYRPSGSSVAAAEVLAYARLSRPMMFVTSDSRHMVQIIWDFKNVNRDTSGLILLDRAPCMLLTSTDRTSYATHLNLWRIICYISHYRMALVYFSGFNIWDGVNQLMVVKLVLFCGTECVRSRRTTSVERFADQPPSV